MDMTEDQKNEEYGIKCMHCTRKTFLSYEYEYTCIAYGYNGIERKCEFSKTSRKKILSRDWKMLEKNFTFA